jgi:DNA adenine methylase
MDKNNRVTQPLKTHGGKRYMASYIHAIAAPFKWSKENPGGWFNRVIPFAGGLGEMWGWDYEDVNEVVNDIDGRLADFYEVLRSDVLFPRFQHLCECTPFSQEVWRQARAFFDLPEEERAKTDMVGRAWRFFVLVRQSMSGRQDCFTPLTKTRLRRGMNAEASAWLGAVDGLPEAHARLRPVVAMREDALKLIPRMDSPNTLFYIDPPYYPSSRSRPDVYKHEMTAAQHEELLDAATSCEGYVMISGYDCEAYSRRLNSWEKHEFPTPNHSGKGKKKRPRVEVVWANFGGERGPARG